MELLYENKSLYRYTMPIIILFLDKLNLYNGQYILLATCPIGLGAIGKFQQYLFK